jgi:hypothetical protein
MHINKPPQIRRCKQNTSASSVVVKKLLTEATNGFNHPKKNSTLAKIRTP